MKTIIPPSKSQQGGEMTQALYAHMNNKKIKNKLKNKDKNKGC
jgi:hypothetical protein